MAPLTIPPSILTALVQPVFKSCGVALVKPLLRISYKPFMEERSHDEHVAYPFLSAINSLTWTNIGRSLRDRRRTIFTQALKQLLAEDVTLRPTA